MILPDLRVNRALKLPQWSSVVLVPDAALLDGVAAIQHPRPSSGGEPPGGPRVG